MSRFLAILSHSDMVVKGVKKRRKRGRGLSSGGEKKRVRVAKVRVVKVGSDKYKGGGKGIWVWIDEEKIRRGVGDRRRLSLKIIVK